MVSFRLEWLDRYLAYPVARGDLDCMGRQLGLGVFLVRSYEETGDDLGLAEVPHSHSRGRRSFHTLDKSGVG